MARRSLVLLTMLLIISSILTSSSHGRKLLTSDEEHGKNNKLAPTLFDRLYFAALPKGKVSPSTPSKKGHSVTIDEKLVARHLRAINRILRGSSVSVPSPGAGN